LGLASLLITSFLVQLWSYPPALSSNIDRFFILRICVFGIVPQSLKALIHGCSRPATSIHCAVLLPELLVSLTNSITSEAITSTKDDSQMALR